MEMTAQAREHQMTRNMTTRETKRAISAVGAYMRSVTPA
jgi:hypothetical protein